MLLDDLVEVIETLKARIDDHGTVLRENETRTRMALIDPLLTALGWDTSDPALVTPEYSISHGRADYALLTKPDAKPVAVLEAKKLDEPLDGHRMQMLNYANISGIPHTGLTDGNRWELYKALGSPYSEQRCILNLCISGGPIYRNALNLLCLWHPNLIFSEDTTFPDCQELNFITPPDSWISLPDVSLPKGQGKGHKPTPPQQIRFPDREARSIGRWWWEVQTEVSEWLIRTGRLCASDCPINGGEPGWSFINSIPRKPDGRPFSKIRELSGGVYLDLVFRTDTIIERSERLLRRCGVDPATVELRFG